MANNQVNDPMREGAPQVPQELIRVPASQVQMGLMPRSLDEGIKLATMMSRSAFVPKDFQGSPENILVAMQMGAEVGFAPMQALQSIAVINGRPSIWGDGLLALVMASVHYDGHEETLDESTMTATAVFRRKGKRAPVVQTFSQADAKAAGLWAKGGPWSTYPKRMLQMRARAFAIRDCFPDVIKGLAVAEEALDLPAVEVHVQPAVATKPAANLIEADVVPDGYDEFLSDLQAAADEGDEQFLPAFQAGKLEYRARLTSKDVAQWNRMKVRSGEISAARKKAAAADVKPETPPEQLASKDGGKAERQPAPAYQDDDPFNLKGGR